MRKYDRTSERDPIPEEFGSLEEAANFWDTHDPADYEDLSKPVQFKLDIRREALFIPLTAKVGKALRGEAKKRHVRLEVLANRLLEKSLAGGK